MKSFLLFLILGRLSAAFWWNNLSLNKLYEQSLEDIPELVKYEKFRFDWNAIFFQISHHFKEFSKT